MLSEVAHVICDPQRRSRSVEVFGQFGGESCQESLGDREFCRTDAVCDLPPLPECSDSEFQCESGDSASFKTTRVSLFIHLGSISLTLIFASHRFLHQKKINVQWGL